MIIDCNLLAYEFDKSQYTPHSVYPSGEKDEDKGRDKILFSSKNPAILVLENDIVNKEGYGLKRGFYNVTTDKYLDYLYIYQTGNLKAKIPVISMQLYETMNPKQEKIKKMSYSKYKRYMEKEKQKYIHGENPSEIDYKTAEIHYIEDKNSYILIYNQNNIELMGIIKF